MVAANLLHRLDHDRYRATLVCFNRENGVIPRVDTSLVTVKVIEKKETGVDPALVPRLAWHLSKARADIVHTYNAGALVYGFPAAKLARVPVIIHADHGRIPVPERPLLRATRIRMTKMTDHVVVVSEELRRLLTLDEGVSADKVSIIINGVDLSPFDRKMDRADIRRSLGIAPGEWVTGTVGSLTPQKNQALLIRAAARVPGARVLIAGTGPLESEHNRLTEELGIAERVQCVGLREDIPRFLRALDLFVLPSITEGTSLALLEAMAARLPVLATDVGGNRAVLNDTGILIPSDDIDVMTQKLEWCKAHPKECQKLGLAARERLEQHYSLDKTVEAYDALFEASLAGLAK